MEILPASTNSDSANSRDTMFMFGGLALMLFGAGLILTNPIARKYLGGLNITNILQGAIPDFDKYLKLRSM